MAALVIIVILIFAIPNIISFISKQAEEEREKERVRQEQEKVLDDYYTLVQKYMESGLTYEILNYICDGDFKKKLPEEIVVSHNTIRSTLNGCPHSFDFKQHRIAELRSENWRVSATEAMAEAINLIMGRKYTVYQNDGVAHMELEPMYDF